MTAPRITSREDVDRIENTLLSLVLDQEHNVFDDTEDLRAMADLARTALSPEPGASALDTPEAREALQKVLDEFRLWGGPDTVALALDALAPFVASVQAAAWRAGVEAAGAEVQAASEGFRANGERARAAGQTDGARDHVVAALVLRECVAALRALPVPAAFAAPGPDAAEALRPFAEIGQWLFARDLPDDTPVFEASGINGYGVTLTRGHFKAAHRAFRALTETEAAP